VTGRRSGNFPGKRREKPLSRGHAGLVRGTLADLGLSAGRVELGKPYAPVLGGASLVRRYVSPERPGAAHSKHKDTPGR